MKKSEALVGLKTVPHPMDIADELEAKGLTDLAAKVRAVSDYVDVLEKQLQAALEIVNQQTNDPR